MQSSEPLSALPDHKVTSQRGEHTFCVGICATGQARGLPTLLRMLLAEQTKGFELKKLIIVASGCPPETISEAKRWVAQDDRVALIEHERRTGKADAINEIIKERQGEFVVFVNSDALPRRTSIAKILQRIGQGDEIGVVSGRPIFERPSGVVSWVLDVMWTAHNRASFDLYLKGLSNHGTDELMVAKSDLLEQLPRGVVNDGAYISGKIRSRGYRVGYLPDATVKIDVPTRMIDLVRQRRRILFGHIQVWRLVGKAPRTVESLMLFRPLDGFRILTRTLAGRPKLILAIPPAVVGEFLALVSALWDTSTASRSHVVWRRYGS